MVVLGGGAISYERGTTVDLLFRGGGPRREEVLGLPGDEVPFETWLFHL